MWCSSMNDQIRPRFEIRNHYDPVPHPMINYTIVSFVDDGYVWGDIITLIILIAGLICLIIL